MQCVSFAFCRVLGTRENTKWSPVGDWIYETEHPQCCLAKDAKTIWEFLCGVKMYLNVQEKCVDLNSKEADEHTSEKLFPMMGKGHMTSPGKPSSWLQPYRSFYYSFNTSTLFPFSAMEGAVSFRRKYFAQWLLRHRRRLWQLCIRSPLRIPVISITAPMFYYLHSIYPDDLGWSLI